MARLVLALVAVGLLCRLSAVDAACCTSGQPTYRGSGVNVPGVPTCSDGPCSGPGFDYLATPGASESDDPNSCCDTSASSFSAYNPKAGSEHQWPNYPDFPVKFPATGLTCDPELPRFRCTVGGQAVSGTARQAGAKTGNTKKKFSLRHFL